jgi:hypothetical protein
MSTPSTAPESREVTPEAADVNPQVETEIRVDAAEEGIRDADPAAVRENVSPSWTSGERGGKTYESAKVDGTWYRVYEDGRVLRQEGRTYKTVSSANTDTLPPAVQEKVRENSAATPPGVSEGQTSRGIRYREVTDGGVRYRALETGVYWKHNGTRFAVVPSSQVDSLPASVKEAAESVRPNWETVTEGDARYKQLELPNGGGVYRVSEQGRVFLQAEGGSFEYVAPGESLPPVVQTMLDKVVAFAARQEREREASLNPNQRNRAEDVRMAGEALSALSRIRIESGGVRARIEGLPLSKEAMFTQLSRMSIRPDRYSEFVDNFSQATDHMQDAVRRYGPPNPQWESGFTWNTSLNRIESECTDTESPWNGECIVATAVGALRQPAGVSRFGRGRGASRPENFRTFPSERSPNGYRVVRREASDRSRIRYTMYEHEDPNGRHSDFVASDGGIRVRKTGSASNPDTVQTFGDESNTRPTTVSVRHYNAEARYTSTADPNSREESHTFNRTGNYALDTEGGEPLGSFSDFQSQVESGQLQVRQGQDAREAYADHIVENLRTPDAIASFISAHVTFDGSGRDGIVDYVSERGTQDVQHPLATLERGTGDCEDFALLFEYMLEKAGVEALAMRKTSNHFMCVYFEERYVEINGVSQRRFDAVVLDTSGLRRTTAKPGGENGYESPVAALRASVSADMSYRFLPAIERKYGSLATRDPSTLSESETRSLGVLERARAAARNGGGGEILRPPRTPPAIGSREATRGRSGYVPFNADFSRYVREDTARPSSVSTERAASANPRGPMVQPGAPAGDRTARAPSSGSETARIANEQAKITEASRFPRNTLNTLPSGVSGVLYSMDDRGNLFASRDQRTWPGKYYYLNVQNGYQWEDHTS